MLLNPIPNGNGVLAALTPAVYARLTPNLKKIHLEGGRALFDIGSTSNHAWFITSGIVPLFLPPKPAKSSRLRRPGEKARSVSQAPRKETEWRFRPRRRFQARRRRST